ncbi:MAG: DUF541 domain-containing protein [Alphaproteobacteria bacterium]|nr:DUF541 domain-containing protein [Alphaproteobacteria bacterium]
MGNDMKLAAKFAFALAFSLGGCATIAAGQSTVSVTGAGTVSVVPDTFSVGAVVGAQGKDLAEVLAETSRKVAAVRQKLPQLEGLSAVSISSDSVNVTSLRDLDCMNKAAARYDVDDPNVPCPITGRSSTVELTIHGAPVDRAGDVVSMLAELGATSARFERYEISNESEARNRAIAAAVADARSKASSLVSAMGARLGPAVSVTYADADVSALPVVVTGSKVEAGNLRPATPLEIPAPQAQQVSVRVNAKFAVQ